MAIFTPPVERPSCQKPFKHDLQKVHERPRHQPAVATFFQQPSVPDIVKVGLAGQVEDARLPLEQLPPRLLA